MRIFVAAASALLTDHAGHGEGLICNDLLRGLAARGHDIVACARRADLGSAPPFEVVEIGPGCRLESLERVGYAAKVARELRRRGPGFDVVWWILPIGVDDVVWRPAGDVPFVVGPYGPGWPDVERRPRRLGDHVVRLVGPVVRARHRRALAATDLLLRALPRQDGDDFGVARREAAAPFGVDAGRFPVLPLPEGPVVGYVGSLEPKKGVRQLVEAFAAATAAVPAARLRLAGDGPLRAELEARAEVVAPGAVTFLGPVPRSEVADVLAGCTVLCVPSLGEPYGMVVLEAMAAGRAVVATDQGGPAFLVDAPDGGALVPPDDVVALGAALVEVLADRAGAEAMGRHNRAVVEARYTVEASLDRVEAALCSVAG